MIDIWYWDLKPLLLEFPNIHCNVASWDIRVISTRKRLMPEDFPGIMNHRRKTKDTRVWKCWRIWIELALVDGQGDWQWRKAPSACTFVSAEALWSYEGLWLQRWEMGCVYFINEAKRDASHITRLCSTALILFSYSSKDNQTHLIIGDRRHRSWSYPGVTLY
jgi:hypothetical protein